MALLTVREAAEQVGISRQTMFKMVKDGKVTAQNKEVVGTGSQKFIKMIDTSELLRVFGQLQSPDSQDDSKFTSQRQGEVTDATPATMQVLIELAELRARVQAESARADKAEEREREAKQEKDRILTLLEQQTKLLPAPKEEKKGIFAKIFG